jgi:diphosphomevalonate decarboxylase
MAENDQRKNFQVPDFSLGTVSWRSPSNIALIKYWGKKGFQIPANPSLSMTLSKSFTETLVHYFPSQNPGNISCEFYFEDKKNPVFEKKIYTFLDAVIEDFPYLKKLHLEIHSRNTFPHSAGIASSASAMSALSLCLCSIGQQINGVESENEDFFRMASNIARIGSGSASRSIYGDFATWGKINSVEGTSDFYASPLESRIHPDFRNLYDTILIVNKNEKLVSSRAGHRLMEGHPFAAARVEQAKQNLTELLSVLQNGDFDSFIKIVENEALTLHALMMASNPGFLIIQPETLSIIQKIRDFRKQSGASIIFSLDAGPNVHILYPGEETKLVKSFIEGELIRYCEGKQFIDDMRGGGPKKLVVK